VRSGVGFNAPFYAQFRRGAEIRRIRSHLKAVVLVYCRGGRRWVIGASLGWAYADEGRLLLGWLARYGSGVVGSGALNPCPAGVHTSTARHCGIIRL
jgi:hypothetical protein